MQKSTSFSAHVLSAALNKSYQSLHSLRLAGKIPPHDFVGGLGQSKKWNLESLHRWNPAVADRCVRIAAIASEADA